MDWLGSFLAGRLGLWRGAAVVWLVATAVLMIKVSIWKGLGTIDTDDAMRIVQIRDWLAGQPWFDTTQYRADPPTGFSMHWSRITDLAMVGLMAGFGLLLPGDGAEFAAMIVWPLLQFLVALVLVASVAGSLAGRRAEPLALILFGLTGTVAIMFSPGRIDHHGLQLLGTLAMLAAALRLHRSRWAGAAAALAGAFTLAVGLEALPYWLVICGYMAICLVIDASRTRGQVMAFGLVLAAAAPLLALATNPARYVLSSACDQVAYPVLGLAVVGGLGLALAAALAGRLQAPWLRLTVVIAVGLAAVGAYAALGPNCLHGPMADVDPRLGPIWLNRVQEAISLPRLLSRGDVGAYLRLSSLVLGMLALTVLLTRPATRKPETWLVGGVFLAAGVLTLMQIRTASYALTLACPLMAAALVIGVRRLRIPTPHRNVAVLAGLLVATATPTAAGVVAILANEAREAAKPVNPDTGECETPSSYDALQALGPALVAAPIDSGPFILMRSRMSVLSAPYHRNAAGILAAHAMLTAAPAEAEALLRRRGVRYVLICRDGPSTRLLAKLAPQGLAARLAANATPAWLKPLPAGSGPVRVYEIRPPLTAGKPSPTDARP